MIWIFVGSIMMGAVHDFGALILSMRNQGKSVSEITAKYINPRTKLFFFVVVFLDLLIITAIFGLVIAVIFNMFPASVLPVWLEVPIAMVLGVIIYKRGGNALTWSLIALAAMYVTRGHRRVHADQDARHRRHAADRNMDRAAADLRIHRVHPAGYRAAPAA